MTEDFLTSLKLSPRLYPGEVPVTLVITAPLQTPAQLLSRYSQQSHSHAMSTGDSTR